MPRRIAHTICLITIAMFVVQQGAGTTAAAGTANNIAQPELPRVQVNTSMPEMAGVAHKVAAGEDLQQAIDRADCGDTIALQSSTEFVGSFHLPRKDCTGWVVIRTDLPDSEIAVRGTRIPTSAFPRLAKIVVTENGSPAIAADSGASHYRLVGLEIGSRAQTLTYNLVRLGGKEGRDAMPHDIIIDRCYIHGTPTLNLQRGVALNGPNLAVVDSYISDVHWAGIDSQAIAAWNSPGPLRIEDNFLEASGENILFGGAAPSDPNQVLSDIEVRRNYLYKPLSWKVGDPSYAGIHWSVKNLFEVKNARRLLVEGNIMENNWADAQNGFAVLFTPRWEHGGLPAAVVEDVTFRNNIVIHMGGGVNLAGTDSTDPGHALRTRRLALINNAFIDISPPRWGGDGRFLQLIKGSQDVLIDHNLGMGWNSFLTVDPATNNAERLRISNNIFGQGQYGIVCSGGPVGEACLQHAMKDWTFVRNVIVANRPTGRLPGYSRDNFMANAIKDVKFVDAENNNFRLADGNRYANAATDGKAIGPDWAELSKMTDGVAPRNRSSVSDILWP